MINNHSIRHNNSLHSSISHYNTEAIEYDKNTVEVSRSKTPELGVAAKLTTTVLRPLYRSTCTSRHLQLSTEEVFVGAKLYCPHALADGNQRIRIREKTLEFSTVWSALLPVLPKFWRRMTAKQACSTHPEH